MSRRLPAGNRAVGHDERDEPGHVLGDGPSTALPMESSLNQRRPTHSLSISANTAPIILMGYFLLGNPCMTRLRRLSSRSVRSCTFLVRRLTWCSQGKSR